MQIYKITNLVNNKIYIGLDTKNRITYLGSGKLIRRAITKYGKDKFKKEILEECNSKNTLCKREQYWIKTLHSQYPVGYNISKGGEFGDTLSHHPDKEIIYKNRTINNPDMYKNIMKKRITKNGSAIRKGKTYEEIFGKAKSHIIKTKLSSIRTGIKDTDETKLKKSVAGKNRYKNKEQRQRTSIAMKLMWERKKQNGDY